MPNVLASAAASALFAQTANPLSTELKTAYTRVKTNFIKAAEKMPEDQYDFKPTPDTQTFKERITHIAVSSMGPCSALNGAPKSIDAKTLKTKADVVSALKDSFAACDAVIDNMTDADAVTMVARPRKSSAKARAGLRLGRARCRGVRLHLRVHATQRNCSSFERRTIVLRDASQWRSPTDELHKIDAYWRAANYLSIGQIYLFDNPLLTEPLRVEHIKPRLLGHWGTTPGLNFVYVHLNRVIKRDDLNMIYICGPGHGGPGMVANTYLEGTYSEMFPNITQDAEGMKRLFTQFSFPGGIPSHAASQTPGSINEGGELGYSLLHAYGAVFDNPDLIATCVIGDGEAETGALATSWHSNKFLNPVRDGAVLPILHLERLQNRGTHGSGAHPARRADRAAERLRLPPLFRRRPRSRADASGDGGDARYLSCRN